MTAMIKEENMVALGEGYICKNATKKKKEAAFKRNKLTLFLSTEKK